jgi:hypothetical protein
MLAPGFVFSVHREVTAIGWEGKGADFDGLPKELRILELGPI